VYNILIEVGVPMKLVRLIKICLNKTYSKARIGKNLFDAFLIQNTFLAFKLCFKISLGRSKKTGWD
jgi:hypothetical protein